MSHRERPSSSPDEKGAPIIRLRGVNKAFVEVDQEHRVLEDVDFDVMRGEFVALLGRSGSGKSTVLNLVSGIDLTDSGSIDVDGTDMSGAGEHQRTMFRRRNIGFVFQFFNLLPTLTVEENVLLPLQLNRGRGGPEGARQLLDRVGLGHRLQSFPDRLSGGEPQRVALARALVHDPPILLADEPTGNLDASMGADVLDMLCALARDRGKTLLVATHSHEVARRADRVIRILDRRLIEISKGEL